ncbi:MAG: HAMP domain-containing histidine kinase [Nitrospirae bacterium]|nr:HAMP domain-containing histidine kinase [Nitrospirota bacterium]MBF0536562.1 HAMP domain-containing histidine kinase [Nitrospirota bacterium]MBF0618142.1 HAMP domain-containing histidine kinase [Nitrospirota bacterium]
MMKKLTDDEFIEEIRKRFEDKEKALSDIRMMTKKLEEVNARLQESEALKSNFLSNIKNELNNPMTAIMGLSAQLSENALTLDCADIASIAALIHEESFVMDFQLKNIFMAAELESGETTLTHVMVDMVSLISSIIDSFSKMAAKKGVTISFSPVFAQETEVNANEFFFVTDSEKLQLIMTNLISNAIEFSKEGGTVEIKLSKADGLLHIVVKDYGIGISNKNLRAIFDRFVQVDFGLMKAHKGHGLGLSIVRTLVDLINGKITVDSEIDKWTEFTLTLQELEGQVDMDSFSSEGNDFLFDDDEQQF